ncbi:hypothetical protein E5Q_02644 [Mixia osmundae IAM 14324]|uniref:Uncharacterized protein n=1 Tax=Mixia osmundae (strain CBS 9802 / IAM 14324 / JCM 22182 / KY 12970) TaxID=764103 RepID=G7DZH6_MIXOS|nr:hypothetical protein E5Q_02644 [Mixia osmundae IAM 14324]
MSCQTIPRLASTRDYTVACDSARSKPGFLFGFVTLAAVVS